MPVFSLGGLLDCGGHHRRRIDFDALLADEGPPQRKENDQLDRDDAEQFSGQMAIVHSLRCISMIGDLLIQETGQACWIVFQETKRIPNNGL